jgi:hypothetical protein
MQHSTTFGTRRKGADSKGNSGLSGRRERRRAIGETLREVRVERPGHARNGETESDAEIDVTERARLIPLSCVNCWRSEVRCAKPPCVCEVGVVASLPDFSRSLLVR